MALRYRRVDQVERVEEDETKKKRAERVEGITAKLHALFWVAGSIVLVIYTDIITIGLHDHRVNRIPLTLAISCFAANMVIMLYLTIWIPMILKITLPWEIYCPNMIPTSTVLGLICVITLIIAYWPVYGLLTPLIIFILLMGLLFSTHFIPWPC